MEKKKIVYWIIAIAILLRVLFAAHYTIAGDACRHMTTARFFGMHFILPATEGVIEAPLWAPPAFHMLAGLVFSSLSWLSYTLAEFMVKMLSPLINAIGIIFLYKLYKKLGLKNKVLRYALLFYCFTPVLLYYGYLPYMDTIFTSLLIISLYYFLDGKFAISGGLYGLSILTKYNAVPIELLFAWLWYKHVYKKKDMWLNTAKWVIPATIVGCVWFVRNAIVLGNPLSNGGSGSAQDLMSFFNPYIYLRQYVEMFGVPAADPANLSYLPSIALVGWFVLTALYLVPFIVGIVKWKKVPAKSFIVMGLLSFFAFYCFLMYNRSIEAFLRLVMPIFIFLPIVWSVGFVTLEEKVKKKPLLKAALFGILAICLCMFVLQEPAKLHIANNQWSQYEPTFEWVRDNTPAEGVFVGDGPIGRNTCLPYHSQRHFTLYEEPVPQGAYILLDDGRTPKNADLLFEDPAVKVKIFKQN